MASALKYLHGLEPKIIFRDLSAANVLLTATKAGQADAKLVDFGLAKEATRQQIGLQANGNACTHYTMAMNSNLGSSTALGAPACTLLDKIWRAKIVVLLTAHSHLQSAATS